MSQHDPTTPIQTFLDESGGTQRRDSPGTPDAPDTPGTPVQAAPYRGSSVAPEFRSGPAPTTTIVGLLGLLTTISILVTQATDLDIPWGVVGPVAVVGAGVLLVVLGLAGLRGQRFRG